MDIFARRIRLRAKQLGLSLAQAARRADIPERSFAHYAAGRSEPDLAALVRIARSLGVSADYLLGGDEGMGTVPLEEADRYRERIRASCLMLDSHALKCADGMITLLVDHERRRSRGERG